MGESGGVGCSLGLMDRSRCGSLHSRLSGIATCRGDSCRLPVLGEGCSFAHDGPSLRVNSSCFSIKGVMRIGAGRGSQDEDAFGGEDSGGGESSFRFPSCDGDWNPCHSGGVGWLLGNVLESG